MSIQTAITQGFNWGSQPKVLGKDDTTMHLYEVTNIIVLPSLKIIHYF